MNKYRIKFFNYLLATLSKKVSIKLFLSGLSHIVLFRLETKYKSGLKLNLYRPETRSGSDKNEFFYPGWNDPQLSKLETKFSFERSDGTKFETLQHAPENLIHARSWEYIELNLLAKNIKLIKLYNAIAFEVHYHWLIWLEV